MIQLILALTCALAASAQNDASGVVYIYRLEEAARFESKNATVWVDDTPLVSMPESEFVAFRLPAGKYVFRMKSKASVTPLTVKAGETYYIRASQTAPYNYVQNIYVVEAEQARLHMKDLKPLQAKNVKSKTFVAERSRP